MVIFRFFHHERLVCSNQLLDKVTILLSINARTDFFLSQEKYITSQFLKTLKNIIYTYTHIHTYSFLFHENMKDSCLCVCTKCVFICMCVHVHVMNVYALVTVRVFNVFMLCICVGGVHVHGEVTGQYWTLSASLFCFLLGFLRQCPLAKPRAHRLIRKLWFANSRVSLVTAFLVFGLYQHVSISGFLMWVPGNWTRVHMLALEATF